MNETETPTFQDVNPPGGARAPRFERRKAGRWWFPLAAAFLSLGFVYASAEAPVVFGLVDYRTVLGTVADEPWRNPINRLDPELLHLHKPGQRIAGVMEGGDISYYLKIEETERHPYDVTVDRDGFRNSVYHDEADICVVGDSYIEGINVPEPETLTGQLSALLERPVVNLAQIWYGPQQELAVVRRYVFPRRPAVCVWCFFEGNDLRDMARYESIHADWEKVSPGFHSLKARSLARNVALKLTGLAGPSKDRPDGEPNAGILPSGKKIYFFHEGRDLVEDEEKNLEKLRAIWTACWEECEKRNVKLVVAFVPTGFRVHQGICTFAADSKPATWKVNDLPIRVGAMLAAISPEVIYVDLTAALKSATEQGEETYFRDDTHWTPAGHRTAAAALAPVIKPLLD